MDHIISITLISSDVCNVLRRVEWVEINKRDSREGALTGVIWAYKMSQSIKALFTFFSRWYGHKSQIISSRTNLHNVSVSFYVKLCFPEWVNIFSKNWFILTDQSFATTGAMFAANYFIHGCIVADRISLETQNANLLELKILFSRTYTLRIPSVTVQKTCRA